MYTTIHEVIHYSHDFLLGSEMLRDMLFDNISYYIVNIINSMSTEEKAYFPLINHPIIKQEENCEINILLEMYHQYFNSNTFLKIANANGEEIDRIDFGTFNILEAYTAMKTYFLIQKRQDKFKIKLDTNQTTVNKRFFPGTEQKDNEIYKMVWDIYNYSIGRKLVYDGKQLDMDQEHEIISFMLLCDIALHLPPEYFIRHYIENKNLSLDFFSPGVRYIQAIKAIAENKGFPDAEPDKKFYITLFNFIAEKYSWPTFEETQNAWEYIFLDRLKRGFMVSDLYKLMAIDYRNNNANLAVVSELCDIFSKLGIPILSIYEDDHKFFEYIRFFQETVHTVEGDRTAFEHFNDPFFIMTTYYNHWSLDKFINEQNSHKEVNCSILLSGEFIREIYCRIIAKEFFYSVLNKDCFDCPMASMRCKSANATCSSMKNFNSFPARCSLEIWLMDLKIKKDNVEWR
jgi:hypothetical protein